LDVVLSDAFGQPVDKDNEVYNPGFYSGQVNALWKKVLEFVIFTLSLLIVAGFCFTFVC